MDSLEEGHAAYYRLPDTRWEDVDAEFQGELRDLGTMLAAIGSAGTTAVGSAPPSPGEVALLLAAAGTRLLGVVAHDESDLRQVITTLRTALTVCWDMYGVEESERVTVREHMTRLKSGIKAFEADLMALHDHPRSDES